MGKLLPRSVGTRVEYVYQPGYFLNALARAYRCLLTESSPSNVALVIDEINRGNSAAIFGTVFQLLDREVDGWSDYSIDISDMEFDTLIRRMGGHVDRLDSSGIEREKRYHFGTETYIDNDVNRLLAPLKLIKNQIKLPPNLSLIATMNASDNSIYYMDTAFKRRWDWQYIGNDSALSSVAGVAFLKRSEWENFVRALNNFIRSSHKYIRRVEDKQIGYWFVVGEPITKHQIQNKVMFYLWDSVFSTNRRPLADLLQINLDELVTFGDFASRVDAFLNSPTLK